MEWPATYRTACLLQHDRNKQVALEQALGACAWASVPTPHLAEMAQGPPGFKSNETVLDPETIGIERCTHGSQTSASGAWEFHRIGPFNTTGGKDWSSFNTRGSNFFKIAGLSLKRTRECMSNAATCPFTTPERGSLRFGEDWRWPTGRPRIFAVTEYFLGAVLPDGQLLGYPPIHQHHFHVEPSIEMDGPGGAMISHGDDQCVERAGGVGCMIRRMPLGYATMMKLPLQVSTDQNDIRTLGSARLTWHMLIAIKGRPDDGTLKALTQMRLFVLPSGAVRIGDFGAYIVPASVRTAFWRSGTFLRSAPLLWSYAHTHPWWCEEVVMYVGKSADEMGMGNVGISQALANYTRAQTVDSRARIERAAQRAGARRVCHWTRDHRALETGNVRVRPQRTPHDCATPRRSLTGLCCHCRRARPRFRTISGGRSCRACPLRRSRACRSSWW